VHPLLLCEHATGTRARPHSGVRPLCWGKARPEHAGKPSGEVMAAGLCSCTGHTGGPGEDGREDPNKTGKQPSGHQARTCLFWSFPFPMCQQSWRRAGEAGNTVPTTATAPMRTQREASSSRLVVFLLSFRWAPLFRSSPGFVIRTHPVPNAALSPSPASSSLQIPSPGSGSNPTGAPSVFPRGSALAPGIDLTAPARTLTAPPATAAASERQLLASLVAPDTAFLGTIGDLTVAVPAPVYGGAPASGTSTAGVPARRPGSGDAAVWGGSEASAAVWAANEDVSPPATGREATTGGTDRRGNVVVISCALTQIGKRGWLSSSSSLQCFIPSSTYSALGVYFPLLVGCAARNERRHGSGTCRCRRCGAGPGSVARTFAVVIAGTTHAIIMNHMSHLIFNKNAWSIDIDIAVGSKRQNKREKPVLREMCGEREENTVREHHEGGATPGKHSAKDCLGCLLSL